VFFLSHRKALTFAGVANRRASYSLSLPRRLPARRTNSRARCLASASINDKHGSGLRPWSLPDLDPAAGSAGDDYSGRPDDSLWLRSETATATRLATQENAAALTGAKLSDYTVNYPLACFATRIGGNRTEVVFPAPPDGIRRPGRRKPGTSSPSSSPTGFF
jgi:hypothetical protein